MKLNLRFLFILSLIVGISNNLSASQDNGFASDIFTLDKSGMHAKLSGNCNGMNWRAEDVKPEHFQFYDDLFSNPIAMSKFADRKPKEKGYGAGLAKFWAERFKNGHPHGALTVFNDNGPIGFVVVGEAADRPGAGELAGALIPEVWKMGIASLGIPQMIKIWAPEVSAKGLSKEPWSKGFRCYMGKALSCIDATASPDNIGSWKTLDKNGFIAARFNLASPDPVKDYTKTDIKDFVALAADFAKLDNIVVGRRYRIIDLAGVTRTVSYHKEYDTVKMHFEFYIK